MATAQRATHKLRYEPLNLSRHETRFLHLKGFTRDGELDYAMEIDSLVEPREYRALSYHWGEPIKESSIVVNGTRVKITKSLADALLRLSRFRRNCLLWVDQICINQEDHEEKGQQIQQMGTIYAGAYMVHAWLGAAGDDSDRALTAIKEAHRLSTETTKQVIELSKEEKAAIRALITRPYFTRVWVIQELAKPDWRLIMCGEKEAAWTGLEMVLEQMPSNIPETSQVVMHSLANFRKREREGRLAVPRMLLMHALLDSRRSQASEARDKIYALLSLTRDGSEVVPTPHYSGRDLDVYVGVSRHFIVRQGHTAVILLANRASRFWDGDQGNLPSWVPNWARLSTKIPPWIATAIRTERETLNIYPRYEFFKRSSTITIPGKVLDTIDRCADGKYIGDLGQWTDLSISDLDRYDMKIAWSRRDVASTVYKNTRVGDCICRLENSSLLVVLRHVGHDTYEYVGEVYRQIEPANDTRPTKENGAESIAIGRNDNITIA